MNDKNRVKYFTSKEVAEHSSDKDLWVSYLGKVYDLTELSLLHLGDILMKPILEAAGTDISHWFNVETHDIKKYLDPLTNYLIYYTPHGRFVHIPPPYPDTTWYFDAKVPWWMDSCYEIGRLTNKIRKIKIINMLTSQENLVETCEEECLSEIEERYYRYNYNAGSYTWKQDGRILDMNKTLTENGIEDNDEDFYKARMDDLMFPQYIQLYFNDDLLTK